MNESKSFVFSFNLKPFEKYIDGMKRENILSKERGALSYVMDEIRDKAVSNLSSKMDVNKRGYGTVGSNGKRKQNPNSFKEGVRTVTQGGDNASVIVSITNKGNKGNWLLPVFEGGTDERYRTYRRRAQGIEFKSKESGRTGKIGAIHFFSKAVDSLKGGIGEKFTKEIIRRLKNII